jgi:GNAT superfamily N-acetyltransferase
LTERELPWIKAIVIHSNCFHSNIFTITYPESQTKRAYNAVKHADYLMRHQAASGHSFGVFDLQYEYKTEEARREGGKLMWDVEDMDATGDDLLRQMDFPLVSVAMAYDGINALDMEKLMPLIGCLPVFATIYHQLEVGDTRDPESWKPKEPNEVLLRNATSTRHDYEGQGIMKKMANWLMRYADEQGFRGIQIEAINDAVTHVWSQPPAPYKGTIVSEFNTGEYREEQESDGVNTEANPFSAAKQRCTKIYVDL